MEREFFLGFIKIHILHHAVHEEIYGAGMLRELARHGYNLSPGTLYPVLHSLVNSGYLSMEERLVEGKIRKYYRATPQGRVGLGEARRKVLELTSELLEKEHGS